MKLILAAHTISCVQCVLTVWCCFLYFAFVTVPLSLLILCIYIWVLYVCRPIIVAREWVAPRAPFVHTQNSVAFNVYMGSLTDIRTNRPMRRSKKKRRNKQPIDNVLDYMLRSYTHLIYRMRVYHRSRLISVSITRFSYSRLFWIRVICVLVRLISFNFTVIVRIWFVSKTHTFRRIWPHYLYYSDIELDQKQQFWWMNFKLVFYSK